MVRKINYCLKIKTNVLFRMLDVTVIGAGIAGITTASKLHKRLNVRVFESSSKIGGRHQRFESHLFIHYKLR